MKNNFTADGHQRWLKERAAAKQKAAPAESASEQKPAGFLEKVRRWWRTELRSQPQTQEEKEKSSPKILW